LNAGGSPTHPGDEHLPSLGALTGQDTRALEAVAACWELYASSDGDGQRGALAAVRALLPAMQVHVRPFARELIARSLDWHDRPRLWSLVTIMVVALFAGCAVEAHAPMGVEPVEPTQAELAERCGALGQWTYTREVQVGSCGYKYREKSGPFVLEVAAEGDEIEAVHVGSDGERTALEVLSFDGESCELGVGGREYADPLFFVQGEELDPSQRMGEFRGIDYGLWSMASDGRAEVVETLLVDRVDLNPRRAYCFQQFLATAERAP